MGGGNTRFPLLRLLEKYTAAKKGELENKGRKEVPWQKKTDQPYRWSNKSGFDRFNNFIFGSRYLRAGIYLHEDTNRMAAGSPHRQNRCTVQETEKGLGKVLGSFFAVNFTV